MAITWGSYNGHLRFGIDLTTSTPSTSSTSVTVTVRLYIQCEDDYRFDDTQTWTLSGNGGSSDSFNNTLDGGESRLLYSNSVSAPIDYDGTGTMTYSARLSGAFNGASPTHTRTITLPTRPPSAPSAPAAPAVGAITTTTATVSWSAPASNGAALNGHAGQVSRNSGFTNVIASWSVGSWQTSRALTGLPKGSVLYARIQVRNAQGWSVWSGARAFTTSITTASAPGPVGFSNIGPTSVNVAWTAPADSGGAPITAYEIQRATDPGFTTTGSVTVSSSPGTLTGLLPGTTYYVRSRAITTAGPGAWSTTTTVTTLSAIRVGDGAGWRPAIVWVGDGTRWIQALVKVGNGTVWK